MVSFIQAQCDQQNRQTWNYLMKGHHLYGGRHDIAEILLKVALNTKIMKLNGRVFFFPFFCMKSASYEYAIIMMF